MWQLDFEIVVVLSERNTVKHCISKTAFLEGMVEDIVWCVRSQSKKKYTFLFIT